MALLKPRMLALVALVCLAASCVLAERWGLVSGPRFVFDHGAHIVEENVACAFCHAGAKVREEPGMPSLDSCNTCHYYVDEEQPPERQVATLYDAESEFVAARVAALDEEVIFEHLQHVEADLACSDCHEGIEDAEDASDYVEIDMALCMACHEERSVPNECATCHTVIDEEWAPSNHEQNWERRHGPVCRREDSRPANDCGLCHEESTCVQCHLEVPPTNHDANFRLRGHGILARADRQNCAACHEGPTCDRCHEEVLPLNHAGLFGGTRSTHCGSCHFPLESNACITCHKAAPSHALGTPKPAWHLPSMNCRSCHGSTLPLSHVDNGSNCNLCHP